MNELKQITDLHVPAVNRAKRGMSRSEGTPAKLYNGRDVVWKRIVVPAMEVATKTVVFGDNERVQALLNSDSISDITNSLSRYGPDKAAIGRVLEDGMIEIGDGSRRRASAIQECTPYPIDVTDLTDDEMLKLSLTGNIYRKPSVYEHGQRYLNIKESLMLNNTQLVEHLAVQGEVVSRRNVSRYINTASLPIEIIQAFKVANDCSADIGEKLWRALDAEIGESKDAMLMRAIDLRINSNLTDPKDVLAALLGSNNKPEKPKAEKLHKYVTVKSMKNGGTAIELDAAIPEDRLIEIKQFIEMTLIED